MIANANAAIKEERVTYNEARKFAQQGYTAFIADVYGDAKTADNPKDAGARYGDEATLFRLAGQLEKARPWFDPKPPIVG